MEIRVLGPIEVMGEEGLLRLAAPMQRRLLAALVIGAGGTCSRDGLIDALWGESPPVSAPKALQVYTSQLRKLLPAPARIRTRGGGYALELDDRSLDADRFERLLDEGRESLAAGNPALAMSLLTKALDLWRGVAYADVAYDDFARVEAERLDELRRVAIEERNEAGLALGRHEELLGELTSSANAHPLRERLQAQAMVALYRCGRQSDALQVHARTRARLRDELGLEPGPELRELQMRVLQHDPSLVVPVVKDEPLALPIAPNALLGRDRELSELRQLLLRDDVRLVVLSGAGGAGKTRLALEVARQTSASFANGAAFVSLAQLRDPGLVVEEISRTLRVRESAGTEPLETLVAALRTWELLLVVDNAEHLRAAAPVFVELIAGAPRLTLLVTSRVVLHVSGEHVYPVEPLDEDAATALFNERARDASPHFSADEADEAIGLICERLDGLPLAIELAASRTRVLTPGELLERLDPRLPLLTGGPHDLPARQQTLRATLDWTVDLLDEDELRQLMHLAVFAGGCTLAAAGAVAGTSIEQLSSLIDHNLLRQVSTETGSRYSMLETIREYALELLETTHDVEARRAAHAAYYVLLAEQLGPDLERGRQAALDRIETELDNFRAAFAWAQAADAELALKLAASLTSFWFQTTNRRFAEGRRWLEGALEQPHTASHELALVAAALGRIYMALGELELAGERIDQAVEIAEALGFPDVLAGALNTRYVLLHRAGRKDARRVLERAIAIARAHDLTGELLRLLYNLSYEEAVWDRIVDARRADIEGLELARTRGFDSDEKDFVWNLIEADIDLGDWDAAFRAAAARQSLPGGRPSFLSRFPWLFVQRGELGEARRALEKMAPLAAEDGIQARSLEANARAVVRRAEGRALEALAAAQEVLARRALLGGRHGWVKLAFVEAVEAAFALDDLDRVAELLHEWEVRSSELRTPFVEAHEKRFAARLAARRGEGETVEPSFLRATEIFRELSIAFYLAVTLLEHGEWVTREGRFEDAEPLLAEACAIFERLRAVPWLERVSQVRHTLEIRKDSYGSDGARTSARSRNRT